MVNQRVRGFSIVEMLMVILIIAILSALVVASSSVFSSRAKGSKTDSILAAVRSALELSAADQAMSTAPAEHPLAGSAPSRLLFIRSGGGAVSSSGLALRGVPLAQVRAANRAQLLLDDDIFADTTVPQLYGMRRSDLGILGVPQTGVTAYRKLPATLHPGIDPNDPQLLPDSKTLVSPNGVPGDNAAYIDKVLGATAVSELVALGGLRSPPREFIHPIGNVVASSAVGSPGSEKWLPDHLQAGFYGGNPCWRHYRIPGVALYDAWGTEILYSVGSGGLTVVSAGPDRCFRWNPEADGMLATAADADAPAPGDKDGARDNRVQGAGR